MINGVVQEVDISTAHDQPEGLVAPSQGNAQPVQEGSLFVGWGALPYFSRAQPRAALGYAPADRTGPMADPAPTRFP